MSLFHVCGAHLSFILSKDYLGRHWSWMTLMDKHYMLWITISCPFVHRSSMPSLSMPCVFIYLFILFLHVALFVSLMDHTRGIMRFVGTIWRRCCHVAWFKQFGGHVASFLEKMAMWRLLIGLCHFSAPLWVQAPASVFWVFPNPWEVCLGLKWTMAECKWSCHLD